MNPANIVTIVHLSAAQARRIRSRERLRVSGSVEHCNHARAVSELYNGKVVDILSYYVAHCKRHLNTVSDYDFSGERLPSYVFSLGSSFEDVPTYIFVMPTPPPPLPSQQPAPPQDPVCYCVTPDFVGYYCQKCGNPAFN